MAKKQSVPPVTPAVAEVTPSVNTINWASPSSKDPSKFYVSISRIVKIEDDFADCDGIESNTYAFSRNVKLESKCIKGTVVPKSFFDKLPKPSF